MNTQKNEGNSQAENKTTSKNKTNTQSSVMIKQKSMYSHKDKAEPDNNLFWEKGHNPLSSKGD